MQHKIIIRNPMGQVLEVREYPSRGQAAKELGAIGRSFIYRDRENNTYHVTVGKGK